MNQQPSAKLEEYDLEESEIINRRFRELIQIKDASSQTAIDKKFSNTQLEQISKRFNQLCQQSNKMNYEEFRRGLGLLGRQDSFICRIFNLIDDDGDGLITQQNYTNYLNIILKGNDLEKSRFGWLILTEGKGDIEFKDFMELFQQISVVWNALTGQIITPKRKYIEELFNTFDVDQDQSITFKDYRLFFNEHLLLFGWFEYFNNIDIDEQYSKYELEKVRQKLRTKLQLQPRDVKNHNSEEIKLFMMDTQFQVEKKLFNLSNQLRQSSQYIKKKRYQIRQSERQEQQAQQSMYESLTYKSGKTSNTEDSLSLKSLYKYNYAQSIKSSAINKIHLRKEKIKSQNKGNLNIQIMKELNGFLQSTHKIMELCQHYREFKEKQKKDSPTKLKQMQVKLNLFDKQAESSQMSLQKSTQKMSVYFGHQNWNLVLNIMVGLRKSIKALYDLNTYLDIKDSHFTEHHQFFLGNKSFLSGKGPSALKNMQNFLFIEIAPAVFERLRSTYGISNTQYQKSVGPQSLLNQLLTGDLTALNEKCSTGKSGAFFYLTADNRIFLKTISKSEFIYFTQILKNYYEHMINNNNTLIVRIYGLYKLKVYVNKQKVNTIYFISMENIFSSLKKEEGMVIEQVYDLKGSLYGRTGEDGKELKDQDWVEKKKSIKLPPQIAQIFKDQIKTDSRFFKKNNINDYSLMVAFVKHSCKQSPKKNGNIFKSFKGGIQSKQTNVMMILTIIDILTVFQARKNLQYIFKSTFLSKDVSCIPPSDYCHRFREFITSSVQ